MCGYISTVLNLYSLVNKGGVPTRTSSFYFRVREINTPYYEKGVIVMIVFTVLLAIVITIAMIVGLIAAIAAGSFITVFGDVIVFGLIVWLIVKVIKRLKK